MKTLLKVFSASILALCIVTPALAKESERTNAFDAVKGAIEADQKRCEEVIKAAKKGDRAKLVVLFKQGYNMECSTEHDQKTPLMEAALHGKADAVGFLVSEAGVDVNRPDERGKTALMYAAEHDNPKVIKKLRARKDLNVNAMATFSVKKDNKLAKDNEQMTALMIAAKKNKKKAVDALLEPTTDHILAPAANANIKDKYDQTALMLALKAGHQDVVIKLIPATADLNAYDKFGQFPLFVASAEGRDRVVKELLRAGVNIDRRDGTIKQQTSLMAASKFGKKDAIVPLVNAGAQVNAISGDGRTALLFAAEENKEDAMLALLAAPGIDVNVQIENPIMDKLKYSGDDKKKEMAKKGKTALMFAAERGKKAAVSSLLGKNADLSLQDDRGRTALIHAAAHGKLDIMKDLLSYRSLHDPENSRDLLNINAQDKDGKTALILAVEKIHGKNKTAIVEELLAVRGIKTDLRDKKGKAAVDHTKKKETVALLDPDRAAKMPDTPDVEEEEIQVPSYRFSGVASADNE